MKDSHVNHRRQGGFSLIELLVVIAIMAIMAGIGIPLLVTWMRMYTIKAASQQVTTEIAAARNRAISRNVNFGVVFVIMSPTQYRFVVEDDLTPFDGAGLPSLDTTRRALSLRLGQPEQVSQLRTLPQGVQFGTACAAGGIAPNNTAMRFNRMGAMCAPAGAAEPCPAVDAGANWIQSDPVNGSTICLTQPRTGLSWRVFVAPGGRVRSEE